MPFKPTEEQALAISAEGTILVSAAAGSGKTAVLTNRVLRKMLEGSDPIPADRLLVVTFTNAAAAEMRGRIERLLSDALAADPGNPRILRQTLLLQNAHITTIDAFCLDLVRENFDRLGVSPDFKIASAEATAQLADHVLEEIFAQAFAERSPEFTALLEAIGGDFGEDRVADAIVRLYDFSASTPFPKAWRHTAISGYAVDGALCDTPLAELLFEHIASEGEDIAAVLQRTAASFVGEDRLSGYCAALRTGEELATELARLARAHAWDALRKAIGNFAFPRTVLRTGEDPELEQAKALYTAATKNAKARVGRLSGLLPTSLEQQTALMKMARPVIEKLVELCDQFEEALFAAHVERNLLTFADAEHLALSLFVRLGEDGTQMPASGADALCDRFDEVLVDEYQDTNKLQDTLFYAISDAGKKLFMVGDVKQSIYRFRHADPDGFLEKKERFVPYPGAAGEPSKIILGHNFRSRPGICHFVNFCFSALMNETTCGMSYAEEDYLVPAAVYPEVNMPEAELLFLDCAESASRIEGEAAAIGRYICDAVEAGSLQLRDPEHPSQLRPARYGDFAILLRSFSGKADVYAAGLKAMGIPVSVSAGGLLSAPEIQTFLSILKVISNPTRDLPLLAALTSPVFGFRFEEVAALRADQPEGSLYALLLEAAHSGNERVQHFLDQMELYRHRAAARPVDRFLLELLEDTGYIHLVLAMENGAERQANLLLLVDMATQFAGGERMTLSQFLARLERADQADTLKAAPPVASGEEAVKIMSVHSSKGLQFPVCILANCAGKLNKTDLSKNLLIDEQLGIGLSLQDEAAKVRYSTLAREAIGVSAAQASVAEELRLLYVAMTRAEEKLLMVVSGKSRESMERLVRTAVQEGEEEPRLLSSSILSAGSYADWLILAAALHPASSGLFGRSSFRLPEGEKPFLQLRFETASPPEEAIASTFDMPEPADVEEAYACLTERFAYHYPYAALGRLVAKTGVSRLAEEAAGDGEYVFAEKPAFLDRSGLSAAERGTATHKFMQFADYAAAASDLDQEIDRLVARRFLSEEEAAGLYRESLCRFFESALYAELQASPRLMREVRFIDELPASRFDPALPEEVRNEPVIVQGIADCIYEIDGGLVILDYKTDQVEDLSVLRERYAVQLQVYAAAAEKTFGLPVRRCVIYSFYKNCSIIL